MRRPTATTVSAARMNAPLSSSSARTIASATSAFLRASRVEQARGNSPRFGVSSMSAGRNASGSMPAWLTSASRRGEPKARTNFGRPITGTRSRRDAARPARRGPGWMTWKIQRPISLEAVGDGAFGPGGGGHLDKDLVAGKHADAVLAHASGGVGDDLVIVFKLDAERGVREQLRDDAGKFQKLFLRHSLSGIADRGRAGAPAAQFARNLADDGPFHNSREAAASVDSVHLAATEIRRQCRCARNQAV